MAMSARIYRFNGRLRILAIGITAEKGNQIKIAYLKHLSPWLPFMILLETINVTCFSRTSVCLASKLSCRDVIDHKVRGRGKFCIKLRDWFTSLRHKTTFSFKNQQNCMYFPKIMRQKKQNLGFLNKFVVIKNGTWRCIKRIHILT